MRSTRGTTGAEPTRADAAARRLALLAADLGAADPPDYTRVVPARRAVPTDPPAPAAPIEPPVPAEPLRPGRHAARRRLAFPAERLPVLGAPHLTVLAVLVAVGVALAAWWVVRERATPVAPTGAAAPVTAEPLVAGPAGSAATGGSASASAGAGAGASGTVTVDVTGKVRRPGIVVLDAGARVVDALEAAGGERPGVDLASLNLARVLVDGEQIVVGRAGFAPAAPPVAPSGSPAPGAPTTLVNLNTATQAELETLPDVGPVTAGAILAWRDEHGGFTSVDELLEVDGIGEVTLGKLSPYVTV